jgi:hypothetical protein
MKSLQHFILLFFGVFCLCSCSEVGTTLSYASLLSRVINTPAVEYGIAFTPAGDSCFFVRHEGQWGRPDNPPASVYLTTFENGGWSDPELAFFSQDSTHEDDVFVSPDGNAIYFVSNRMYRGKPGKGGDIWRVEKVAGSWGEPEPLDSRINTAGMELSPVTNRRGDLYFASVRPGGLGQGDIYVAKKQADGRYADPELLQTISSEHGEWNVFVAPDDQWLIFESSGRPGSRSSYGDLYISENSNGFWQEPRALKSINTPGSDLNVRLGPDGQFLFYACTFYEDGINADIIRVPMSRVR